MSTPVMHRDSVSDDASEFDAVSAGSGPGFGHLGVLMDIRRVLVPADAIAGVLVDPPIVPVPGAGAWLVGVMHYRNMALTVLDLQAMITVGQRDAAARYVVLMRWKRALYGVACDEVYGFRSTTDERFALAHSTGDRRWTDEFSSHYVPANDGEAWCLLDPARVEFKVQERIDASTSNKS